MTPEQRRQLDACLDIESGLTEWEVRFLEDLERRDAALTPRQAEILKRIWEQKS